MKHYLCALVLCFLGSSLLADPVPDIPELEAFIARGEFVTSAELKARGGEVEQRYVIQSYRDRLGLSEAEVRERFPEVISYVGYLGGGKLERELYDRFRDGLTIDHEDLYIRHNAIYHALRADPMNETIQEQMRLNILAMEERGYSPIRVAAAAYDYRNNIEFEDPAVDDRFMLERFANMLGAIEMDTAARIYVYDKFIGPFIDSNDLKLREPLIEFIERQERVDPWTLNMVYGVNQERIAWKKRGSGYANTVSDEEFKGFHDHLDDAMVFFRKAYELDPACPQASHFMLKCVYPRGSTWRAEGWDWFGRALMSCIDYDPVFDSMRHILQYKWRGDETSRAEFAVWCARPDLAGSGVGLQSLYTLERVWWNYGVDYGDADAFWEEEQEAIEAVMRSLQLRIESGADDDLDYEHSILAFMEYRYNGDVQKTAAHIRACENGISDNARRRMRFDDLNLVAITLPLSVEQTRPEAMVAVGYEQRGELDKAIEVWEQVYQRLLTIGDDAATDALRDRLQGLRWRSAYDDRAGWIDLTFDEQMSGWIQHDGRWERVDERTVRTRMKGRSDEQLLVADLITGYWYEMEASVRLDGNPGDNTSMGINFCRGSRKTDGWDQMRFISARPNEAVGAMGWHYAGKDYKAELPEPNEDGTYRIRLRVMGDQVEGYINDVHIGTGEIPNWKPEKEPSQIRVGLGSFRINASTAYFSNIRIRKRRPPENIDF